MNRDYEQKFLIIKNCHSVEKRRIGHIVLVTCSEQRSSKINEIHSLVPFCHLLWFYQETYSSH